MGSIKIPHMFSHTSNISILKVCWKTWKINAQNSNRMNEEREMGENRLINFYITLKDKQTFRKCLLWCQKWWLLSNSNRLTYVRGKTMRRKVVHSMIFFSPCKWNILQKKSSKKQQLCQWAVLNCFFFSSFCTFIVKSYKLKWRRWTKTESELNSINRRTQGKKPNEKLKTLVLIYIQHAI